jgi:phosphopantothenoylcysteine decarboxylase/phosphopantothenate--cysteine ligase
MKDKKILVIVSGSIAAYKSASLVSALSKQNVVKVIMTKNATKFITPLTFETLTKQKVLVDMFDDEDAERVSHIYYGQEYDLIIVAPATANIIGKTANGIADDLATSTLIAATKPVFFVPAMNKDMYLNPITQLNLNKLRQFKYTIIEPDVGDLACGCQGIGKFPSIQKIISELERSL